MNLDMLKSRLRNFNKSQIIITDHAKVQAYVREIDLEEVKNNIVNPEKLVYYEEQKAEKLEEEKFDCYFAHSRKMYDRYVVVVSRKLIIVTIIRINRDWQKIVEGKK